MLRCSAGRAALHKTATLRRNRCVIHHCFCCCYRSQWKHVFFNISFFLFARGNIVFLLSLFVIAVAQTPFLVNHQLRCVEQVRATTYFLDPASNTTGSSFVWRWIVSITFFCQFSVKKEEVQTSLLLFSEVPLLLPLLFYFF